MFQGADWSGLRFTVHDCSPQQAQRIAMLDPTISFFFFCREPMVLSEGRTFAPGDAVFFSGQPWWGSAPQCDGYQKDGLSVAYIGNLGSEPTSPLVAARYVTAQGLNAVDIVCLFAANLAQSVSGDYVRLAPDVPVPAGGTLAIAHQDYIAVFQQSVATLQASGITVLLSFLNNHDDAGWSQFSSEDDAKAFAAQLEYVVATYGFDGIDIDDEYSAIDLPLPNSLAMVTSLIRQQPSFVRNNQTPGKILSKALFNDLDSQFDVFSGRYEGVGLAENLSYGWQMSYNDDPQGELPPYVQVGMAPSALAYGYQGYADLSSEAWLKQSGYAGVMVYPFENPADQQVMGDLVNGWMGPGNWNQASASGE